METREYKFPDIDDEIRSLLQRGPEARTEALHRVVEAYFEVLAVHARALNTRSNYAEPDLVALFFHDLVSSSDPLHRWERSGMPLARWLTTQLQVHAQKEFRDAGRSNRRPRTEARDARSMSGKLRTMWARLRDAWKGSH